jgi:CHAD domain-containing protein
LTSEPSYRARELPAPHDRGQALVQHLLGPPIDRLYRRAEQGDSGTEEWIHDVRVGTRRLQEAMAMAEPLLVRPGPVRRRLRELRRDLGTPRELDVVWSELRALRAFADVPPRGATHIEAYVQQWRDSHLEEALRGWPPERLAKQERKAWSLLDRRVPSDLRFRDLAANHVAQRCAAVDAKRADLECPSRGPEHHRLRIAIKRLRYAVELGSDLFAAVLDPAALLKRLKAHQDHLGQLNDAWDLLRFVRSRPVQPHLGPAAEAVEEEGRLLIQSRHAEARDLARKDLRRTVGEIRRACGRVGRLARA